MILADNDRGLRALREADFTASVVVVLAVEVPHHPGGFVEAVVSPLTEAGVPDMFPRLRFGFVEAGASWIPYVIKELGMRGKKDRASFDFKREFLEHFRYYVTCDTEDDIPGLVDDYGAGDYLMIGTDYSHQDASAELKAHQVVEELDGISPEVAQKIVTENARRLYGL